MKIQVLFGSASDERVYGPLCRALEKCGEVRMEVASAHRDPERVREVVTTCGADAFVTGAGLAAHLPGVVASLTTKPVFGVAVNGAFAGLDAFLSIAQMPRGVPVMAVTEENAVKTADFIRKLSGLPKDRIALHWNRTQDAYAPMQKTLEEIKAQTTLPVVWVGPNDPTCLGEVLTPWDLPHAQGLNLFICEKENLAHPQLALDFYTKARYGGFWVGANNVTNYVGQWKKLTLLGAVKCN